MKLLFLPMLAKIEKVDNNQFSQGLEKGAVRAEV